MPRSRTWFISRTYNARSRPARRPPPPPPRPVWPSEVYRTVSRHISVFHLACLHEVYHPCLKCVLGYLCTYNWRLGGWIWVWYMESVLLCSVGVSLLSFYPFLSCNAYWNHSRSCHMIFYIMHGYKIKLPNSDINNYIKKFQINFWVMQTELFSSMGPETWQV